MTERIPVTYVTSSPFKRDENEAFVRSCTLSDGRPVADVFEFIISDNTIQETLEVSLDLIVRCEVREAYRQRRKPCIVEHAGLVFSEYSDAGYPGGLTKPMWNALREQFLDETQSNGRRARAEAVIGYCDGKQIQTFRGVTEGSLANAPRGERKFYWDTLFVPDGDKDAGLTYAEIVAARGLDYKMTEYSQSTKAMLEFLEWRLENRPALWSGGR